MSTVPATYLIAVMIGIAVMVMAACASMAPVIVIIALVIVVAMTVPLPLSHDDGRRQRQRQNSGHTDAKPSLECHCTPLIDSHWSSVKEQARHRQITVGHRRRYPPSFVHLSVLGGFCVSKREVSYRNQAYRSECRSGRVLQREFSERTDRLQLVASQAAQLFLTESAYGSGVAVEMSPYQPLTTDPGEQTAQACANAWSTHRAGSDRVPDLVNGAEISLFFWSRIRRGKYASMISVFDLPPRHLRQPRCSVRRRMHPDKPVI
jgi:hypothetical protein